MQTLHGIEYIGSLDDGLHLINSFLWGITVEYHHAQWFVNAGDQTLFSADNRPAVDAFLYGMALAYSVLSPSVVAAFRSEMREALGGDFAEATGEQ